MKYTHELTTEEIEEIILGIKNDSIPQHIIQDIRFDEALRKINDNYNIKQFLCGNENKEGEERCEEQCGWCEGDI